MPTTTTTAQHFATYETLAANLAKRRGALAEVLQELEAETLALRNRYRRRIREAYACAAGAQAALHAEIQSHPEDFAKPRTITLHGIKLGWQKAKGRLVIVDEAKSCALIRRHFPEQVDTLVKTTETVVKAAAAGLSGADLKRIGIAMQDAADEVVLKAVDSDLDKLIDRMLGEAAADQEDEA